MLGETALMEWGWRVPFLMGSALMLLALWMRHRLPETLPLASKTQAPQQADALVRSIGTQVRGLIQYRHQMLQVMALVCTSNVIF